MSGVKFDQEKLRWDLVPPAPLQAVVAVYTLGAKKYGDRNWEKGISYRRMFAAMMRHAWAWWRGEVRDPEDGQHHLAAVVFYCLGLMQFELTRSSFDDRIHQLDSSGRPGVGQISVRDAEVVDEGASGSRPGRVGH